MGHYARMLIEVDLRNDLEEKLMYRRADQYFCMNLQYERLTEFCWECCLVGHSLAN